MKTKQWFIDRIGKKVYRSENGCHCSYCKDVDENGLVIRDENHAIYLHDIQVECNHEGINLNYRDDKEIG